MSNTPNLALTEVPQNSTQPSYPINASLRALDALAHLAIETTTNTPPTTVSGDVGKRWIIGASPTGAWVGNGGKIALCVGANLWQYLTPKEGWSAYDRGADVWLDHDGTAWAQRITARGAEFAGLISGLTLEWVSSTALTVTAGAAHIQSLGRVVAATSSIAKTSLSLASNTWFHVYLYLNAGTPDVEIVSTAPDTAYSGTARSKTGDTSRRYLGSIRTNGSGGIRRFSMDGTAVRWEDDVRASPYRVLAGGTASTWTSVSLAAVLPVTARGVFAFIQLIGGTVGTDISSDSAGGRFLYTVNPAQFVSGMFTFDQAGQAIYYKAPAANFGQLFIDVNGYTLAR